MVLRTLIKTVKTFLDNDPMSYAASIAFYTVISLPAILLVSLNLLSQAYQGDNVEQDLLMQLNKYLGPSTVAQAEIILENAAEKSTNWLRQALGYLLLVFSATTIFISLQNAINKVWGVDADSESGFYKLLIDRILSFAMIVSIGFVLLVSLVIDSLLKVFQRWIENNLLDVSLAWIFNIVFSLLVTSIIFSLIFKVLPDVKIKWSNVWVGGVFTAFLFLMGKFLIGLYLSNSDLGSAYGSSGSLVVFLMWVYYSAVLILFGAKFTYQYTLIKEKNIVASKFATFVKEETITKKKIDTSLEK